MYSESAVATPVPARTVVSAWCQKVVACVARLHRVVCTEDMLNVLLRRKCSDVRTEVEGAYCVCVCRCANCTEGHSEMRKQVAVSVQRQTVLMQWIMQQ